MTPDGRGALSLLVAWTMFLDSKFQVDLIGLLKELEEIPRSWVKPESLFPGTVEEKIEYDLRTCSFLIRRGELYSFSHQTFYEFFCAQYLFENLSVNPSPLAAEPLATYGSRLVWRTHLAPIVRFLQDMLSVGTSDKVVQLLGLTHQVVGYGGNALTLIRESNQGLPPEIPLGKNLRGCACFAIDLSKRALEHADLSKAALVSPNLQKARLQGSLWVDAACRMNLVYRVAFLHGSDEITIAASNSSFFTWKSAESPPTRSLLNLSDYVHDIAIDPISGRCASSAWDRRIFLWCGASGKLLCEIDGGDAGGGKVALSPNAEFIVGGSGEKGIGLWETAEPNRRLGYWKLDDGVGSVCFGICGRFAAAVSGRALYILVPGRTSVAAKITLNETDEAKGWTSGFGLACAEGGLIAVSVEEGTIWLCKVKNGTVSGRSILSSDVKVGAIYALAFSSDGRFLAAGGPTGVQVLDVRNGHSLMYARLDQAVVKSVAFSSDSKLLLSGGFDGVVRLWHLDGSSPSKALDLGIYCWGADLSGAKFGTEFFREWSLWESWWMGAALRQRMLRCGAVDGSDRQWRATGKLLGTFWWDGEDYENWRRSITWDDKESPRAGARAFEGIVGFT